jgi:glycosyltransferase involved in cell wall biosynthesis
MAHGTQNKILESMAMGLPVVTTPEAAKGIQATPGEHILVAGEPDRFAGQVVEILANPQLRLSFANAGREQVNSAHVWSRSMEVLDNIFMASRV